MPDDLTQTKCLTQGALRLTAEVEAKMVDDLLKRFDLERRRMGWDAPGVYKPKSWLYERWIASRMYESDYSHRGTLQGVFSVSNRSLNVPKDFIDTHFFRASQDLLGGDSFFNVMPEGPEDQSPAVKLYERYLQRRAKIISMQTLLDQELRGVFARGELIYKATDKVTSLKETRDVRFAVNPDGKPALDSQGNIITELDQWDISPTDPGLKILLRDPTVSMLASADPHYSAQTQKVLVEINPSSGCCLEVPYWGDMVIPVTNSSVRNSDFAAHTFELALDDLADVLPPAKRTPAFDLYYAERIDGPINTIRTDEATAVLRRGENDDSGFPEGSSFMPIRLAEIWARVEVTPPGTAPQLRRREDICMLVDIDRKWPIAYDYRHAMMPWAKDRRNPFGVIRISPVEKRWFGMGYYQEMRDASEYADKQYNRMEVDMMTSGNQIFRDKNATEEGKAGRPPMFRSLAVNTLVGGKTAADAFAVVTIPSQAAEIQAVMDRELQRMQASKGIITPAEAGQTGLAAADTLGGMQILEKTSDVQLKQRERDLLGGPTEGLIALLGDFAEIEAVYFDLNLAEKLFAPLSEQQQQDALAQLNAGATAPGVPPGPLETPPDNVAILTEWLQEITQSAGNLRNRITVAVAPKNSSAVIEESNQAIQVIQQWFAMGSDPAAGPPAQEKMKDIFVTILRQLGVQNPENKLPISQPPPPVDPNGQPIPAGQPQPGSPAGAGAPAAA